jgi:flavin-dependent dehydrogenase
LKFHVPRDRFRAFPEHEIQIYAGRGIYCGLNAVNDGDVTLCFLERRAKDDPPPRARFAELVASHPGLQEMAGPDARSLLMDLPVYGVSGIDFGRRPLVRDGVLMIGDAARVIAPVAGDGIAVAMESARLLSEVLIEGRKEGRSPSAVGRQYQREWNRLLRRRMVIARAAQSLLLTREGARFAAAALRLFPPLQLWAIRSTRA